jgi:glutamyl-Q tRNA(Asp) synthetase
LGGGHNPLDMSLPAVSAILPAAAYRGRFAPSPTGPLHAGSLVAALASWLDARAQGGKWLVRIEDLDPPREVPGAGQRILRQLAAFGLESDHPVLWQSTRHEAYAAALERLIATGQAYPCVCSRAEVAAAARALGLPESVYPGTCAQGLPPGALARAWRLRLPRPTVRWHDRAAGEVTQDLHSEVGDFVLKRADGLWAYQLAVVVDDAAQGISDVVRGADLLDNTPRQRVLQAALGMPQPRTLHVPLVLTAHGEKLSKQTGAAALDETDVAGELARALAHLGLPRIGGDRPAATLAHAVELWGERWVAPGSGRPPEPGASA